MTVYNNLSKLIHIGNFPELDTDEGSYGYEGSTAPIIGTVISGPSANSRIVDFDYDDADGDGLFEANHRTASAENVTIDGVSSEVDETVLVTVRLTYADGSTSTESILGYQLENGEFYLGDLFGRISGQSVYSLEITNISDTGDYGHVSEYQGGGDYDLDSFSFVELLDYEIDGTASGDLIDGAYTGDPEGGMIDNNDHSDGSNSDLVNADAGDDTVQSGLGDDTVYGGTGDDSIQSGSGDDTVYGEGGSDTIEGGAGDDYLSGGDDNDRFDISDGFGNDTIVGGEGGTDWDDEIDLTALTGAVTVTYTGEESGTITDGTDTITFSEIEDIDDTAFDDYFDLSARTDDNSYVSLSGGGNDTIIGGAGNDSIVGGEGGGNLAGGSGDDTVTGGSGSEDIYGNSGDDLLDAGGGDDWISAGSGQDTILTGEGNDYFEVQGDTDRDVFILEVNGGNDSIYGFDLSDIGDGTTIDQFDSSGLTDGFGNPMQDWDVTVTDTNGDGTGDAILTFPTGESVTLEGLLASQVDDIPELMAMGFVCFAAGTLILTPDGYRKAEEIVPGDFVTTFDRGPQRVRWAAASAFGSGEISLPGNLVPVRIKPGALGNTRPLIVSQQHCILMKEKQTDETFLIRAKHLAEETKLASYARGQKR